MNGNRRRELKAIFARFERSNTQRFLQARKAFTEEINKLVKEVEEYLGIDENTPIEGETRTQLMIFINGLLDNLQEYDECFHNQADEIDRLNAELEASLERERIQAELLELYRQLQSAQSVQHQELLDKIQHLTQQIEELSKKSASRRKATPGASEQTDAERRKGIEARIKRVLAYHDKMLKELEALDAKAKDGSATSSSQGTTEPVESDESETDRQVQSDDHADSSDIPGQEKNTPAEPVIPPLADSEPNNPPLASSAPDHPDASPSHDSEELPNPLNGGPSDSDKSINTFNSVDGLLETIRDMEEKLNRISDEMEERIYEANKGPRDSNTPSGKAAPWTTCKGRKKEAAKDTDANQDNGDGHDLTPEEIENMEKEAEEAALHDSHKSPFNTPGGKRGKPVGSGGGGRTMPVYDEKRVHHCAPEKCAACPHCATCKALENARAESESRGNARSAVRNEFDIEIKRVLIEHRLLTCVCPEDGQTLSGTFPEGVNSWFQYGRGIKALVITLSSVGMVSYERIADIVRGLIDDSKFSAQAACTWVNDFPKCLSDVEKYIKAGVFSGPYLNSDESGIKVKGVLHWVHVACNMTLTYMRVDRQRGDGAMDRIGILTNYIGTVISDCWASYWDKGSQHGLCNAHLLRELFALVKFFERDKQWAQKMMDLLNEMNDERNKLIAANIKEFPPEVIQNYRKRYEEIVEEGLNVHPDSEARKGSRGKPKKYRGRNLLDRLKEHEDNFLLFLEDFDVPFTNNIAERALRMFSIKRSVVGCFDSYEGADNFALTWSYISSAGKRNGSAYEAIKAALDGKAVEFLFDEEEIAMLDEVIPTLSELNWKQFLQDRESDKEALNKARTEAQEKQAKADQAKAAVENAEEKARAAGEEADRLETETARKKVLRARTALEKARKTADKTAAAAQKASKKADDLYESAKYRAESALYFLGIEDFDWNFDEAMAS